MGNGCNSLKSVLIHEKNKQKEEEPEIPEIKILVVGDNFVGKTSFIQRFVNDTFFTDYKPTKEVEITSLIKNINVPKYGLVKVQMWEVPGYEKVDVRRNYYADSNAVVVVIDSSIDTSASFISGAWWKEDVERNYCITKMENRVHTDDNGTERLVREKTLVKSPTRDLPILLIGNKFDLVSSSAFSNDKKPSVEELVSEKTNEVDEQDVSKKDTTELVEGDSTTKETVDEHEIAEKDSTKENYVGTEDSFNKSSKETNKVDKQDVIKKDTTELVEGDSATKETKDKHEVAEKHSTKEKKIETENSVNKSSKKANKVDEQDKCENDENELVASELVNSATLEIVETHSTKENNSDGKGDPINESKVVNEDNKEETDQTNSSTDRINGVQFDEEPKVNLKEKEMNTYLENYVEEFELFASDQGFVSSILVSSSSPQGGASDAVQSLIRRALVRCPQTARTRTTLSLVGNCSGGPDKWELFNIQEVGVDEIDDMLRQGIPLIEEGEKLRENFKNAINLFKKACTENTESEKQLNTEECIDWLKMRVKVPLKPKKENNKREKETDLSFERNSKLIMVNVGNFFQLGVASDLTGDIIGSSMLDEDVISVLKIFNHQVWKYCNEVINKSDIIEKSLLRIIDQLAFHEENLWEKSSDYQQQQVTFMTSSITRDKTKVRGLLCDVKDTKSDVIKLRARVRAAVLF